ncbi:hypothetical protein BS78_K090700 [Paspalum vaginatum]|uniref:Uncharacterized protein n=1 Tax=Paspalum vaginatum TaxID=158149 RepID=A0A9W7XCF3_9POAL|nr:hypothetical protein BS78_K090700 [Paspalum vaginatum]
MALSTIGVCCFCFPPGIGLSALKQLTNQYSAFSRNQRLIQWFHFEHISCVPMI